MPGSGSPLPGFCLQFTYVDVSLSAWYFYIKEEHFETVGFIVFFPEIIPQLNVECVLLFDGQRFAFP
jgi:hypothetical protein